MTPNDFIGATLGKDLKVAPWLSIGKVEVGPDKNGGFPCDAKGGHNEL